MTTSRSPREPATISPAVALPSLLAAQGYRCFDCDVLLWSNNVPETYPSIANREAREATIDHVIPRCMGGTDTWENYEVVCAPCNTRRWNHWKAAHPGWQVIRTKDMPGRDSRAAYLRRIARLSGERRATYMKRVRAAATSLRPDQVARLAVVFGDELVGAES